MNRLKLLCIICTWTILNHPALAWKPEVLDDIVTDRFTCVALSPDEIAYCGSYYGLVVIDLEDPENPRLIERLRLGKITALEVRDTLLFLCRTDGEFSIYSITNQGLPALVCDVAHTKGVSNFCVEEDLAYLTGDSLRIVDISDPSQPTVIGTTSRSGSGKPAIISHYAYSSGGNIFDIGDPEHPERVVFQGNYGSSDFYRLNDEYLLTDGGTIHTLDDPLHMERLASFGEFPGGLALKGSTAFLMDRMAGIGRYGIACYSLRDPADPTFKSELPFAADTIFRQFSTGLDVEGDRICAVTYAGILSHILVGNNNAMTERGVYANPGRFESVARYGDYVYASMWFEVGHDADNLTYIFNVSNGAELVEIGSIDQAGELTVVDDRLFIQGFRYYNDENGNPHEAEGLMTYSLANPEDPEYQAFSSATSRFALKGDYRYSMFSIGRSQCQLNVVDISDPNDLRMANQIYYEADWGSVGSLSGDILVTWQRWGINNGTYGQVFWNISDPVHPEIVGEYAVGETNMSVLHLEGNLLYRLEYNGDQLDILDISDPANIQWVRGFSVKPNSNYLKIEDGMMVIGGTERKNYDLYSLEYPERPELIGSESSMLQFEGVSISGSSMVTCDATALSLYDLGLARGAWYLGASEFSHDFGEVALDSTGSWDVIIRNNSYMPREINDIVVAGDCFDCDRIAPARLESGEEVRISVFFSPHADSIYSGAIMLYSDDKMAEPILLSGRGILPASVPVEVLPHEFAIESINPNPSNSSVRIGYSLATTSDFRLVCYDLSGRLVSLLDQGRGNAGRHTVVWQHDQVGSGVYFLKLESGVDVKVRKLVVMK